MTKDTSAQQAETVAHNDATIPDWRARVKVKQEELARDLPLEWWLSKEQGDRFLNASTSKTAAAAVVSILDEATFLSKADRNITETKTANDLVKKLASRELKAVDVVAALSKRAAIGGQLLSCTTETYYPQALERARHLDDHLERHGTVVGPLHGLPVSVKECFEIAGKQSTCGYVALLDDPPATKNSSIVDLLLDLGAVIYVKTNIPQTMMTADSENNVFGRTLNPHHSQLNAGGSSGGEGALISFCGSVLGVGTDIAGSVRIPALCCGVYGFKPTADRVPYGGQSPGFDRQFHLGLPGITAAAGPLARSVQDLELFMASVCAKAWKYDASVLGAGWSRPKISQDRSKSFRIGIIAPHPLLPLHPPVQRALDSAIAELERAGHSIIRLPDSTGTDIAYGSRLIFAHYIYAPQRIDLIAAGGEPPVNSVVVAPTPMFTGPPAVDLSQDLTSQLNDMHSARAKFCDAWRELWVDNDLDAILAPGAQTTAVPHDSYPWPFFTCLWNLLDWPACIIPYGRASKLLDPHPVDYGTNPLPTYRPEVVDGMPCAVQVVTPRFQDEDCLECAKIIDEVLRSNVDV